MGFAWENKELEKYNVILAYCSKQRVWNREGQENLIPFELVEISPPSCSAVLY